jgi:hypothetical protein
MEERLAENLGGPFFGYAAHVRQLARFDHLLTFFGFFAILFLVKLCVSVAAV